MTMVATKAFSCVWPALALAFGLVSPNQVNGEAGCIVIEVPMDQQASSKSESTATVRPREKVKPPKHEALVSESRSLDDEAMVRVKAFVSGQNLTDYCGDIKIVESDGSGQYRPRN
jgi:hypothetical protein